MLNCVSCFECQQKVDVTFMINFSMSRAACVNRLSIGDNDVMCEQLSN